MIKEAIVATLAMFVLSASIAMCFQVKYIHEENMAKLGYEETMVIGKEETVWRKIR